MARDRRPRDDEDEDDRPRRRRRDDDDDEDEDRPRRRSRAEDDEDEERPRRKSRVDDEGDDERPRLRSRARDDDDEDDDDRPRRRRKTKPAGMSKGLLFGLIGVGVALVGLVVLLIVLLSGGGSPKSVMQKVIRAVKVGDYGTMYDNMSARMQQQRGLGGPRLPGMNVTATDPRERFIETMKAIERMGGNQFDAQADATIVSETIIGDTAVVRMRNPRDGREVDVPLIKENGRWKLNGF